MKEKAKKTDRKNQEDGASYSEKVKAIWFCCAFKLGFVQLMCKACLISKTNLELDLSMIFKEIKFYESKHAVLECRCLKNMGLLPFLIWSSILILKSGQGLQM